MAKTLIQGVNEILKKTGSISGDSGELTTLTDSARQRSIDIAVQVINEGMDELYSSTDTPHPKEQAEDTITLVNGTRSYSLNTSLVQLRWPFIDKTNNQFIREYPGGYNKILLDDSEQDDTGLPHFAAISPVDGNLYLDRAPTSVEDGRVYTYQYDKDVSLSMASDEFPFSDAVFRAIVPAWTELWKAELRNGDFNSSLLAISFGRAARFLTQNQQRKSWSPR